MASLWRMGADTPTYEADDLSGKGAETTGGRWNRVGTPVLYTASSASLACLETVVHLNGGGLPLNRFLVEIDVPDDVWAAREVLPARHLPVGWAAVPPGRVSLQIGAGWLSSCSSALLAVPSVIVPEEFNVLINPAHPDTQRIKARKLRAWYYDQRVRQF